MLSDIYCVYFKASPAIATNHESSLSDVQIDRALDRVIDCFDGPNNTIPQLCERCQLITKTYAKVSKAELSHTTTIQHATTLRSEEVTPGSITPANNDNQYYSLQSFQSGKNIGKPYFKYNWGKIIPEIKKALRWYQNKNIYPTLRQIDYRLISFNMFPGLKKSYTKLSEALTHEKQHGNIDWGVIKDEQRITKDVYPDYYTPKDYLEYKLDNLKNVSDDYDIPKWYMQPNYVEIWIEKGADVDTFKTLSEDWQVNIRQNKGFEGWEAAFQNFKKIVRTMYIENMQKKVYIFYFGDMDPSGDIMEDHLRTQARHFSDYDFGFDKYYFGYGHRRKNYTLGYVSIKRLGVTQDQISKYDIPLDIDSAVMDKLFGTSIANGDAKDKKGDSRTSGFIEKYKEYIKPGDKLPPMAEMDALVTTDELLNEIKRLITNNISPLFNKPIYRNEVELKLEPERERIRKMLNKRIKFTD